jgi:hypothetical protein
MALGDIRAGYRGYADIGPGNKLRFESADISAKQTVNAPEMVMGDMDRNVYNYGAVTYEGNISGPVTEGFLSGATSILTWGTFRNDCALLQYADTIDLYYYCGGTDGGKQRKFKRVYANSLDISANAGDVAQFSIGVAGEDADPWAPWGAGAGFHLTDTEKLVTWDKFTVEIVNRADPSPAGLEPVIFPISSFTLNVNNNIQAQYTLQKPSSDASEYVHNTLKPFRLVPGMRAISGSITAYNIPSWDGFDSFNDYCSDAYSTLTIKLTSSCSGGELDLSTNVRFDRIQPSLSSGVLTSTLAFNGVANQPAAGVWR